MMTQGVGRVDATLKHTIDAAGDYAKAQYDNAAKQVIADPAVLSYILATVVDEYKGMDPKAVRNLIDGEIQISTVPPEPGQTNRADSDGVIQLNTESSPLNEGLNRFDLLFYTRTRSGKARILINIEAQKSEPDQYGLLNRAIFYSSRMISSQKGRDFRNSEYNDMIPVYSVWLCFNMDDCIFDHIRYDIKSYLTEHNWRGNLDLQNIILLGIPNECPDRDEKHELHRLLSILFSSRLTVDQRIDLLQNEYDMSTSDDVRKGLNDMCNLSDGIEARGYSYGIEKGLAKGMAQGMEKGLAKGMAQGMAQGMEQGMAEGIREAQLLSIRRVMKNMNLDADIAMNVLEIPHNQRSDYRKLLDLTGS